MENLIGALGQLGPIGIALIVLVVMWFLNRQTSTLYKKQLKSYADEIDRLNASHDEELTELKTEIKALREDIRAVRAEMEIERTARRRAEEEAHQLKMGGGLP